MRFTSPANREHRYRHHHPRRRRHSGTAGLMSRQGLQDHDGAAEPGFGPSSRTGVQTQLALLRTLPCPETHGRIFFSMKHEQKSLLNRFFTQGAGASLGMCMDYRSGKRRPSPSSLDVQTTLRVSLLCGPPGTCRTSLAMGLFFFLPSRSFNLIRLKLGKLRD